MSLPLNMAHFAEDRPTAVHGQSDTGDEGGLVGAPGAAQGTGLSPGGELMRDVVAQWNI